MSDFTLHPRLAADTLPVTDWTLSSVRLMNDARFPWLVLVPRWPDAREIHRLPDETRSTLFDEINRAAAALEAATGAHKMNVAALGNLVPQLHVHVIARFEGDSAWPGPVWGVPGGAPYEGDSAEALIRRLGL